jgi:hypothetical protein
MTKNFKLWRDAKPFDRQSIVAASKTWFHNLGGEA